MTAGGQRLFAEVLDGLCLRPGDRPRYTNVELAERIRLDGGEITHTYISQLRRGDKDNPTCRTIEGLATALGVHPACFVGGRSLLREGERPAGRRGAVKHLFDTVYPVHRGPFSPEEVAARISAGPYGSISANYLRELLAGTSDNPRLKHVLGLAEAFGAAPAYFFDDELAARVDEQLETRLAMDKLGVNTVILRTAQQPPPPGVRNRILLALVRALHPGVAAEDAIRRALEPDGSAVVAEDETR
ncbi:hypothetical protein AB0G02_35285 [Actinosynnema sp. NPDC023658]|uniref:hypothetical protein n=1 Tax=Actinosynnema sp. NPDC023658 TaxID=3155465 RepID=UPI00340B09D7